MLGLKSDSNTLENPVSKTLPAAEHQIEPVVSQRPISDFQYVQPRRQMSINHNHPLPAKLGTIACTDGQQVFLGKGYNKLESGLQNHILKHEYGHISQRQNQDLQPTKYINGFAVNDNPHLENSASSFTLNSIEQTGYRTELMHTEAPVYQCIGFVGIILRILIGKGNHQGIAYIVEQLKEQLHQITDEKLSWVVEEIIDRLQNVDFVGSSPLELVRPLISFMIRVVGHSNLDAEDQKFIHKISDIPPPYDNIMGANQYRGVFALVMAAYHAMEQRPGDKTSDDFRNYVKSQKNLKRNFTKNVYSKISDTTPEFQYLANRLDNILGSDDEGRKIQLFYEILNAARLFFLTHPLNPIFDFNHPETEPNFGYIRSSQTAYKNDPNTVLFDSASSKGVYGKMESGSTGLDAMKHGFAQPLDSRMGLAPFEPNDALQRYYPQSYANKVVRTRWICQQLAEATQREKLTYLKAIYENNYPCVMIEVSQLPGITAGDSARWCALSMCIFAAIVNTHAIKDQSGLVITERSSFSHINPTLSDCFQTFRISPGPLLTGYQINILVYSLKELNNLIKAIIDRDITQESGEIFQPDIQLNGKSSFDRHLSSLTGRVGNSYKLKELVRTMSSKASVTNVIMHFFLENGITAEGLVRKLAGGGGYFSSGRPITGFGEENWRQTFDHNQSEQVFQNAREVFGNSLAEMHEGQLHNIITYSAHLQKRFGSLLTATHFTGDDNDGYGSDSEDEEEFEDGKIYGKKAVLPTGMRAIVTGSCAVAEHSGKFKDVSYSEMYYETEDILKTNKSVSDKSAFQGQLKGTGEDLPRLILKDVNHCINSIGYDNSVNQQPIPFYNHAKQTSRNDEGSQNQYVYDVTSASEYDMAEIVRDALLVKHFPYVILVSSGLKNEGMGFDNCHTGIIRVFSKTPEIVNGINALVRTNAGTPVTEFTHQMRRTIKFHFGTPTVGGIIRGALGKKQQSSGFDSSQQNAFDFAFGQNSTLFSGLNSPKSLDALVGKLLQITDERTWYSFFIKYIMGRFDDEEIAQVLSIFYQRQSLTKKGGNTRSARMMRNTCWAFRLFNNLFLNGRKRGYYLSMIEQALDLYPERANRAPRYQFLSGFADILRRGNEENIRDAIGWFIANFFPQHFGRGVNLELGQQQGIEDIELGLHRLINGERHLHRQAEPSFSYYERRLFNVNDVARHNRQLYVSNPRFRFAGMLCDLSKFGQGIHRIASNASNDIRSETPLIRGGLLNGRLVAGIDLSPTDEELHDYNAYSSGLVRGFDFDVGEDNVPIVPFITIAYGWQRQAPRFIEHGNFPGIALVNERDDQEYFFRLHAIDVHSGGRNGGHWYGANLTRSGWVMTDFAQVIPIQGNIVDWIAEHTNEQTEMYFQFTPMQSPIDERL